MNDRIRQLAERSSILFDTETVPETGLKYEGAMISREDLEQFAQALVRECADQVDDYFCDFYNRTAADKIKQHFGVAE
jgi:hypothetical protein